MMADGPLSIYQFRSMVNIAHKEAGVGNRFQDLQAFQAKLDSYRRLEGLGENVLVPLVIETERDFGSRVIGVLSSIEGFYAITSANMVADARGLPNSGEELNKLINSENKYAKREAERLGIERLSKISSARLAFVILNVVILLAFVIYSVVRRLRQPRGSEN
jgi:hypothetical protein